MMIVRGWDGLEEESEAVLSVGRQQEMGDTKRGGMHASVGACGGGVNCEWAKKLVAGWP